MLIHKYSGMYLLWISTLSCITTVQWLNSEINTDVTLSTREFIWISHFLILVLFLVQDLTQDHTSHLVVTPLSLLQSVTFSQSSLSFMTLTFWKSSRYDVEFPQLGFADGSSWWDSGCAQKILWFVPFTEHLVRTNFIFYSGRRWTFGDIKKL